MGAIIMWKPSRAVTVSLVISLIALVLAVYGATVSPADAPPARPAPTPLSSGRVLMLLPEGKVEISDAFGRRIFRWDGQRWKETESQALPRTGSR
jgi:hypothetical protein